MCVCVCMCMCIGAGVASVDEFDWWVRCGMGQTLEGAVCCC